jgi:hypothetical protein
VKELVNPLKRDVWSGNRDNLRSASERGDWTVKEEGRNDNLLASM